MENINLRLMFREDIQQCVDLAVNSFELQLTKKELSDIKTEFEMAVDYAFKEKPIYHIAFLSSGEIIGMIGYNQSMMDWQTFELYWLCVNEKYRGKGLAARLIGSIEDQIRIKINAGDPVTIILSCINDLIPFYKKNGYRVAIKKAGKQEVIMSKSFKV